MAKKVVTNVTMVVVNEVGNDEADEIMQNHGTNTLGEVANKMESDVENILATRVFGDADEIAVLDVNSEVEE